MHNGSMRKLSTEKRAMILSALVGGNSINATGRMVGVSKITVLRLLADSGTYCAQYHDLFFVASRQSGFNSMNFGPSAVAKTRQ